MRESHRKLQSQTPFHTGHLERPTQVVGCEHDTSFILDTENRSTGHKGLSDLSAAGLKYLERRTSVLGMGDRCCLWRLSIALTWVEHVKLGVGGEGLTPGSGMLFLSALCPSRSAQARSRDAMESNGGKRFTYMVHIAGLEGDRYVWKIYGDRAISIWFQWISSYSTQV